MHLQEHLYDQQGRVEARVRVGKGRGRGRLERGRGKNLIRVMVIAITVKMIYRPHLTLRTKEGG